MQSFKILALLAPTDSGGYVKFTPKYTIVGMSGGALEIIKGSQFIILVRAFTQAKRKSGQPQI